MNLNQLFSESQSKEKAFMRRFWIWLAALVVSYSATIYLYTHNVTSVLFWLLCLVDLTVFIGLVITACDDISELKYQNQIAEKMFAPPPNTEQQEVS